MKITDASHLDHGLTDAHRVWLLERFGHLESFTTETVELPAHLPDLQCGLYGPIVGDDPITEPAVSYEVRGDRPGNSRMVDLPPRPTRTVSVIIGPHNGECILYTAFGGPVAPREPFDPSLDDAGREESLRFWAMHALARLP